VLNFYQGVLGLESRSGWTIRSLRPVDTITTSD
jgi:hypothetical protein